MTAVIILSLVLVLGAATATVLTTDPARQALTLSLYGLFLAIVFLALAAPDVALSEIAVNAAIVPLIIMLTVRKVAGRRR